MKHNYKKMVAYNPINKTVEKLVMFPDSALFNSRFAVESFLEVRNGVDLSLCIIVGVTITNDLYQLSPSPYGKYIREDMYTMGHIDRSQFFTAVAKYHKDNNIDWGDYD